MEQLSGYQLEEEIGKGAYGVVYKALRKADNIVVAMKRTPMEGDQAKPTTASEIELLKELNHPNVVSLLAVVKDEQFIYMVLEFCTTDLLAHMRILRPLGRMPSAQLQGFLRQTAQALHYCHERRILHRDVKPSNLLISASGTIKLADFGVSCKLIFTDIAHGNWNVGSLWYQAPELLLGAPGHTSAVDIWAMGFVFAEMVALKPLLPGRFQIEQLLTIFQLLGTPTQASWPDVSDLPFHQAKFPLWKTNQLSHKLAGLGEKGLDLLNRCLECDPGRRITAQQIISHPFFQEADIYTPTA